MGHLPPSFLSCFPSSPFPLPIQPDGRSGDCTGPSNCGWDSVASLEQTHLLDTELPPMPIMFLSTSPSMDQAALFTLPESLINLLLIRSCMPHPLPPCLLQLYLWEEPMRQVFAAKETLLFGRSRTSSILGLVTTSGQEKMCLKRKDPTHTYVFFVLENPATANPQMCPLPFFHVTFCFLSPKLQSALHEGFLASEKTSWE